jgi:hypothetical protein
MVGQMMTKVPGLPVPVGIVDQASEFFEQYALIGERAGLKLKIEGIEITLSKLVQDFNALYPQLLRQKAQILAEISKLEAEARAEAYRNKKQEEENEDHNPEDFFQQDFDSDDRQHQSQHQSQNQSQEPEEVESEGSNREKELKSLFRRIMVRTHPDKVKNKALNALSVEALDAYAKKDLTRMKTIWELVKAYKKGQIDLSGLKLEVASLRNKLAAIYGSKTYMVYKLLEENPEVKPVIERQYKQMLIQEIMELETQLEALQGLNSEPSFLVFDLSDFLHMMGA